MTSLLRLPDWLGGHECSIEARHSASVTVSFVHDGEKRVITVQPGTLVEVEPPLPPEPEQDGSFVTVDSPGNKVWAFSRRRSVRASMGYAGDDYWWWHDNGDWVTWKQICGMGAPKVLVPDPVQDAPDLPYSVLDGTTWITVAVSPRPGEVRVSIDGRSVDLDPFSALKVAAAIWAGLARQEATS